MGGLCRPRQVARVRRDKSPAGQANAEQVGLPAAFFRKRRIELPLDPVLAVPLRLPMTDQEEACRCGSGGRRGNVGALGLFHCQPAVAAVGLRRLRARWSNLDIYTNFLLIPDRPFADPRRRLFAVTRLTRRN